MHEAVPDLTPLITATQGVPQHDPAWTPSIMPTQSEPQHDPAWTSFEPDEQKKARQEKLAKLRKVLQTSREEVFEVSADGQVYIKPDILLGVPVAKITESSPYWDRSWNSLDAFLERQATNAELREEAHKAYKLDRKNANLRKEKKRLDDNSSKFIKIQEIFGDGPYHPNQIAAKHHLPVGGFCTMDYMYKLACKISDMKTLHSRGELKMDPFDFVRWRLAKLARQTIMFTGQRSTNLKTLVSNLGASAEDSEVQDPVMREACLLAATYQGRLNSYGPKKRGRTQDASIRPALYPLSLDAGLHAPQAKRQATTTDDGNQFAKVASEEEQYQPRQASSHQQIHQSTAYNGVNDFRAKRPRVSNVECHPKTHQ